MVFFWVKTMDEALEERLRKRALFEIYGPLLTATQRKAFDDYYSCDLSLSEIANDEGISRSAVSDALKKGYDKLEEYESKLGLLKTKAKAIEGLRKADQKPDKESYRKVLEDMINGI